MVYVYVVYTRVCTINYFCLENQNYLLAWLPGRGGYAFSTRGHNHRRVRSRRRQSINGSLPVRVDFEQSCLGVKYGANRGFVQSRFVDFAQGFQTQLEAPRLQFPFSLEWLAQQIDQ